MYYGKKYLLLTLLLLNITKWSCAFGGTIPSERDEKEIKQTKIFLSVITGTACLFLPSAWNLTREIRPLSIPEAFVYHNVLEKIAETDNTVKSFAAICIVCSTTILTLPREQLPTSKKKLFFNKTIFCSTILGFALGWQLKNLLVDHFNAQLPPIVFKLSFNRA